MLSQKEMQDKTKLPQKVYWGDTKLLNHKLF
jgi:hypothetical protein